MLSEASFVIYIYMHWKEEQQGIFDVGSFGCCVGVFKWVLLRVGDALSLILGFGKEEVRACGCGSCVKK